MKHLKSAGLAALMVFIFLPGWVRAQSATTGAIAGTVRDTTGAVLPGVTVEAASPALIEKVRSVVTDEHSTDSIEIRERGELGHRPL